jgi:hypothetical protein
MATAGNRLGGADARTAFPFVLALAVIGFLTYQHGLAPGAFMLGVLNTGVLLGCCGALPEEDGWFWYRWVRNFLQAWFVPLTVISGVMGVIGTVFVGGDGGAWLQAGGIVLSTLLTMVG